MRHLFFTCALAVASLCAYGQQATFNNPVIRGDYADPSIIRVGDEYFAAATSSEWAPFFPLFSSKDLVNWKAEGHVFNKQPEWTRASFWAPELFTHNGVSYVYYTARRKSDGLSFIGVATADNPRGPYTDHGVVVPFGIEAIDASILVDNGEMYIVWKAYGLDNRPIELLASKLSDDGLRLVGETFSLLKDDVRQGMEGQQWVRVGEYYYIIYSIRDCCSPKSDYAVSIARSRNLKGPYERFDGNPILEGGGPIQSLGHGTFTTTPDGRMFFLCHSYLAGERFYQGRQPVLQEIALDKDGWLSFVGGKKASLTQPLPFKGCAQDRLASSFFDNFDNSKLGSEWCWNFTATTPDIEIVDGRLNLSGQPKDGVECGVALCVRSAEPNYTFETTLLGRNNGFSGVTIYGDDRNLLVWGIEGNKLIVKSIRGDKVEMLNKPITISGHKHITFRVEVRGNNPHSFSYRYRTREWITVETLLPSMRELIQWDRVARVGLYYQGPASDFAQFDHVKLFYR